MQTSPTPFTRDLVLVGGGHTHALILRKWGMQPLPGARLTVVNPEATAPYSGMLPGHLAGHYERDALDIDLVKLARFAGARLRQDRAVALNLSQKTLGLASGQSLAFDVASIDIGITSRMPDLPGFSKHAVPAKPLGPFADAWRGYLSAKGPAQVAVIGAGVAGAEIALALSQALRQRDRPYQLTLIDRSQALAGLRSKTAEVLRNALAHYDVEILENANIEAITAEGIVLSDHTLPASFVCGAAGAHPQTWLGSTGLELHDGFIAIDETLSSSAADVFAVGDCAHMAFSPRPKAGVYAVRQAPVLFENMRNRLRGFPAKKRYVPQDDYLKLISLGQKSAIGDRFGLTIKGPWVWRWKDRIDQTFMKQFSDLPPASKINIPKVAADGVRTRLEGKPLCGGCAAKIGQPALQAALQQSPSPEAPGDDAALLHIGSEQVVLTTDHLRDLLRDPIALTDIAIHHAMGDVWAMGARPTAVLMNVTLPEMSDTLAERSLTEIMATARRVVGAVGAEIVGGHSALGAELSIGVTLLGRPRQQPITLQGAQPGDALVLTKPLGSGVILAAEMAGQARGDWVQTALEHMTRTQGDASSLLSQAHAMTDVTGFGFLGHLRNICLASGVGAQIQRDAVPVMPGVLSLLDQGVRASLNAQNHAPFAELPDDARHAALWDPQTSGGLLAAIADQDGAIVEKLRAAGYPAVQVGTVTDHPGQITVL